MTFIATVLYEDTMLPSADGSYPLHDLVMRLVEDDINGDTWHLLRLVDKNPRRGIDKVLNDLETTSLIAGSGALFILVDSDNIADAITRRTRARVGPSEEERVSALRKLSDAPDRLHPFFLHPNMEGLLKSIQGCDRTLLPSTMAAALRKNLNERDIVLKEARKAARRDLRACVRQSQPGLDKLAIALAALIKAHDAL